MSGCLEEPGNFGASSSKKPLNMESNQSSTALLPEAYQDMPNSNFQDAVDASPQRMQRPSKSFRGIREETARYQLSPGIAKTLPSRQHVDYHLNQVSLNSISSSESYPNSANTSFDAPDAVPLRIQRMPLFSKDYIKQRQASVENLCSNRTPHTGETVASEPNENDKLLSPCPSSRKKESSHLDPHINQAISNGKSLYPTSNPLRLANGMENDGVPRRGPGHSSLQTDMMGLSTSSQKSRDEANYTEEDLTVQRQPKPLLDKGAKPKNGESCKVRDTEESNRSPEEQAIISTPPRNSPKPEYQAIQAPKWCCCDSTCVRLCYALFCWKTLCSHFSAWNLILTLISIGIFIFDVVTDLILSLTYYHKINENEDFRFFFGLTLGLVIGPSVIVQAFSFYWVVHDHIYAKKETKEQRGESEKEPFNLENCVKLFFSCICHIFQCAVLFRYFRVLYYGFKSRYYLASKNIKESKREAYTKHFDTLWRYEIHDIEMLRLLESFLESAPQLVLQTYIMLMTKQIEIITLVSCIGSLLGLSTMMVSIQRAIRNSNPDKQQLSIKASIVMFCWRACTISSRVLAFAVFLTIQPLAFLIFILSHWIAASVWIACRGTNFCGKNKPAEYFFDAMCGLIHIFCFFNVHEESEGRSSRARFRMLLFYLVVLVESFVLTILWYFFRPGGTTGPITFTGLEGLWLADEHKPTPGLLPPKTAAMIQPTYALMILLAVHVLFLFGMLLMFWYYAFLHPRKQDATCCCSQSKDRSQDQPNKSRLEGSGTKLVSEIAEEHTCMKADSVHEEAVLTSVTPNPSQGYNTRLVSPCDPIQGQEDTLRQRRRYPVVVEAEDSDSEDRRNKDTWSETIFDRGKRAKKLYTRQYSREKMLDDSRNEELRPFSSMETERFSRVVTPTRELSSLAKSSVNQNKTASIQRNSRSKPSGPVVQSIVIQPGSRSHSQARRSATQQELMNMPHSLNSSPLKRQEGASPKPATSRGAIGRGYSASMSCLVGEKPLSYTSRRKQALKHEVERMKTLKVEEMESSV